MLFPIIRFPFDFSECKIRVGLEFATKRKRSEKRFAQKWIKIGLEIDNFISRIFSGMKPTNFQFHKLAPK